MKFFLKLCHQVSKKRGSVTAIKCNLISHFSLKDRIKKLIYLHEFHSIIGRIRKRAYKNCIPTFFNILF